LLGVMEGGRYSRL